VAKNILRVMVASTLSLIADKLFNVDVVFAIEAVRGEDIIFCHAVIQAAGVVSITFDNIRRITSRE
jgi:hypothetical protein